MDGQRWSPQRAGRRQRRILATGDLQAAKPAVTNGGGCAGRRPGAGLDRDRPSRQPPHGREAVAGAARTAGSQDQRLARVVQPRRQPRRRVDRNRPSHQPAHRRQAVAGPAGPAGSQDQPRACAVQPGRRPHAGLGWQRRPPQPRPPALTSAGWPAGDRGTRLRPSSSAWAYGFRHHDVDPLGLLRSLCPRSSSETADVTIRRPRPAPLPRSAFAGFRFPPDVIVLAVRWYLRFGLSYRDVEELLTERGVEVDHIMVYRWVSRFTPLLAEAARPCRHAVGDRWFVDETYVRVAGQWG